MAEDINATVRGVSDICWVSTPSETAVQSDYEGIYEKVETLRTDVGNYEYEHLRDFENIDKIISALDAFLDEALAGKAVTEYTPGSVLDFSSFEQLGTSLSDAMTARDSLAGILQIAGENENARYELLIDELAEQRKADGIWQMITSGLEVLGGALVIVGSIGSMIATCGASAPLAIPGIIAGVGMITHGGSNFLEGLDNYNLGKERNITTVAGNPVRDSIFGGNQKAWDIFGLACGIVGTICSAGAGGWAAAAGKGISSTSGIAQAVLGRIGMTVVSGGVAVGVNLLMTHYGTKWFGPNVGRYVGLISGIIAGIATYAGLNALDKAVNFTGLYPKPVNNLTDFNFKDKTLTDVDVKDLEYVKRDPSETATLRNKFNNSVRSDFLKTLAETRVDDLKAAGFTDADITAMANGSPPNGYQVHHIVPLDDGGTNDFSNLVLIDQSNHGIVTAYQNSFCHSLQPGQSINIT